AQPRRHAGDGCREGGAGWRDGVRRRSERDAAGAGLRRRPEGGRRDRRDAGNAGAAINTVTVYLIRFDARREAEDIARRESGKPSPHFTATAVASRSPAGPDLAPSPPRSPGSC